MALNKAEVQLLPRVDFHSAANLFSRSIQRTLTNSAVPTSARFRGWHSSFHAAQSILAPKMNSLLSPVGQHRRDSVSQSARGCQHPPTSRFANPGKKLSVSGPALPRALGDACQAVDRRPRDWSKSLCTFLDSVRVQAYLFFDILWEPAWIRKPTSLRGAELGKMPPTAWTGDSDNTTF